MVYGQWPKRELSCVLKVTDILELVCQMMLRDESTYINEVADFKSVCPMKTMGDVGRILPK